MPQVNRYQRITIAQLAALEAAANGIQSSANLSGYIPDYKPFRFPPPILRVPLLSDLTKLYAADTGEYPGTIVVVSSTHTAYRLMGPYKVAANWVQSPHPYSVWVVEDYGGQGIGNGNESGDDLLYDLKTDNVYTWTDSTGISGWRQLIIRDDPAVIASGLRLEIQRLLSSLMLFTDVGRDNLWLPTPDNRTERFPFITPMPAPNAPSPLEPAAWPFLPSAYAYNMIILRYQVPYARNNQIPLTAWPDALRNVTYVYSLEDAPVIPSPFVATVLEIHPGRLLLGGPNELQAVPYETIVTGPPHYQWRIRGRVSGPATNFYARLQVRVLWDADNINVAIPLPTASVTSPFANSATSGLSGGGLAEVWIYEATLTGAVAQDGTFEIVVNADVGAGYPFTGESAGVEFLWYGVLWKGVEQGASYNAAGPGAILQAIDFPLTTVNATPSINCQIFSSVAGFPNDWNDLSTLNIVYPQGDDPNHLVPLTGVVLGCPAPLAWIDAGMTDVFAYDVVRQTSGSALELGWGPGRAAAPYSPDDRIYFPPKTSPGGHNFSEPNWYRPVRWPYVQAGGLGAGKPACATLTGIPADNRLDIGFPRFGHYKGSIVRETWDNGVMTAVENVILKNRTLVGSDKDKAKGSSIARPTQAFANIQLNNSTQFGLRSLAIPAGTPLCAFHINDLIWLCQQVA